MHIISRQGRVIPLHSLGGFRKGQLGLAFINKILGPGEITGGHADHARIPAHMDGFPVFVRDVGAAQDGPACWIVTHRRSMVAAETPAAARA